jgi:hypothetical protein
MHNEGVRPHGRNPFAWTHYGFNQGFNNAREAYRNALAWTIGAPGLTALFFGVLIACSLALFPILGRDFFPNVDAGQMRLHVRAPAGSRIETTAQYFARVEKAVREITGPDQVDNVLANIGLPYSGMNMAVGDTATVGTMDGELLVSLKEDHTPTAAHVADLRRELPKRFPDCQFFFQAADIVNQVLNFGQPAPIDVRVVGSDPAKTYNLATKIAHDLAGVAGVVDSHVYQMPAVPGLRLRVNRELAQQVDVSQRGAASSLLVTLNSSGQIGPNFWVNPATGVSYPLVAQTPTYTINSLSDLRNMPLKTSGPAGSQNQGQLLMNVADVQRVQTPALISQSNVRPVFDVNANVQGRDLYGVAGDVRRVLAQDQPPATEPITVSRRARLPADGHQVSVLAEPPDRSAGRPVRPERRLLGAVPDPHLHERAGPDGRPDVHRAGHGQQHPGRQLRRRPPGRGVHRRRGRRRRRVHPPAAGRHDRRRHDPGHVAHGSGPGRGGRAERPARPGRHRRADVRHLRHAGVRAVHVRLVEPTPRCRSSAGRPSADPAVSRDRAGVT